MTTTTTAADLLEKERGQHYDHLTAAASIIGELESLLNALDLMHGKSGTEGDARRLIGIGQNIADTWASHFEREAEELKALRPESRGK